MANNNKNLKEAKKKRKNEFYTALEDVERQCRYFKKEFKGKTIICNCDDPFESAFFKYFVLNFNRFHLKKLIATCYAGSPVMGEQMTIFDVDPLADDKKRNKPYKAIVTKVYDANGDGAIDMNDIKELFIIKENELTVLDGDGSFDSPECIELLKESDICISNPPFSEFRRYVSMLCKYNKKFLIIGNQNAITYKEIFPLIMNNELWIGPQTFPGSVGFFRSPYQDTAASSQHKDGMIRVSGVCWFTNMDFKKRHEEIILTERYYRNPEKFPKYDNYDAIEVSKTKDIPEDYEGVMGVPITFLVGKYNPDQFKILGITESNGKGMSRGIWIGDDNKKLKPYINGVAKYARIFIRNKHPLPPKEMK